jgi:cyclase
MFRKRVIPSLLLRNGGLVKTRKFRDAQYVGDPINAVKIFNEKEVDELFLFDIDASRDGCRPNFEFVREIVSEAFMPVAYGGGVCTVEDAGRLLALGIEKIVINSAALEDLSLITRLKNAFGAQCVVGSIDVFKKWPHAARVASHSGRRIVETDPVSWAHMLIAAGVGELLIQNVERDGTLEGLDLGLASAFVGLEVPVVLAGGANDISQIKAAFEMGASGVSAGARFVFYGPHRAVLISYLSESESMSLLSSNAQSIQ